MMSMGLVELLAVGNADATTTPPGWNRIVATCVHGSNIEMIHNSTVFACAARCDATSNCVAFEFGVDHGGGSGAYLVGDCQPQSTLNLDGCDGGYFNLDLFVRTLTGSPTTSTASPTTTDPS